MKKIKKCIELIIIVVIISLFGCRKNNKHNSIITDFYYIYEDYKIRVEKRNDSIFIDKISDYDTIFSTTLYMKNGEYYQNLYGAEEVLTLSNKRSIDTIYSENLPLNEQFVIEYDELKNIYVSSSYFHVKEHRNLHLQIFYDKDYNIKKINTGTIFNEYTPTKKHLPYRAPNFYTND